MELRTYAIRVRTSPRFRKATVLMVNLRFLHFKFSNHQRKFVVFSQIIIIVRSILVKIWPKFKCVKVYAASCHPLQISSGPWPPASSPHSFTKACSNTCSVNEYVCFVTPNCRFGAYVMVLPSHGFKVCHSYTVPL